MTRAQRRIGLLVIGVLTLVVVVVGIITMPMLVQSIVNADYLEQPVGTEIVMTKEQFGMMERAEGFAVWGPTLLVSVAALAVAIFVVALRWPEKRR